MPENRRTLQNTAGRYCKDRRILCHKHPETAERGYKYVTVCDIGLLRPWVTEKQALQTGQDSARPTTTVKRDNQ